MPNTAAPSAPRSIHTQTPPSQLQHSAMPRLPDLIVRALAQLGPNMPELTADALRSTHRAAVNKLAQLLLQHDLADPEGWWRRQCHPLTPGTMCWQWLVHPPARRCLQCSTCMDSSIRAALWLCKRAVHFTACSTCRCMAGWCYCQCMAGWCYCQCMQPLATARLHCNTMPYSTTSTTLPYRWHQRTATAPPDVRSPSAAAPSPCCSMRPHRAADGGHL
jgi:hypothetical protein